MSTVSSIVPQNENGLKVLVKRNPLVSMYFVLFGLAWAVMIPQALHSQGLISAPVPMWLEILTGWAPGIAAVVVASITSGRAGVRELLGRFRIWRVGVQWYLVSLFALAALILGGIGLHVLFGGALPVIPAAGASVVNIALGFVILIVAGVLINTEEIAWRGFALPKLQAKYGVLAGCMLLAIPELGLHLPLFFVKENPFYPTVGLAAFSAFSIAMVFIYAFLFNKARGSLLIVTLMHASQNAWANLLSDNSASPFYYTVALAWMIAIALIFLTKGQLGYKNNSLVE
jgi:membrane protease YdiL (CAAX protease family)